VTLQAPSFDHLTARFRGLPAFFQRPDFCLQGERR
jgi:hypothetical protein